MRFIVSSSYLLKKLQIIGGVINSNNTMPILENFLFELSENKLIVSASDLETTIKGVIEVESTDTASIVVPYKILIDTLKTFTEQALTFIINDNNTIDIVSNNGKYTLAYLDSQEFPTVVEIENANFDIIPDENFLTCTSKKSLSSENSTISSNFSSINSLEYPSIAPLRYIFSLAVRFISKPAPNSIIGEIFPSTLIDPFVGFITPLINFNSVDLPAPLLPINPTTSPFSISKFIFFNAQKLLSIFDFFFTLFLKKLIIVSFKEMFF